MCIAPEPSTDFWPNLTPGVTRGCSFYVTIAAPRDRAGVGRCYDSSFLRFQPRGGRFSFAFEPGGDQSVQR